MRGDLRYNVRVNERVALISVAILTTLSLWVAPWAALNRETGARSTLVLLPNRVIDFTGRTEPVVIPGQLFLLLGSLALLAVIISVAFLKTKQRYLSWLIAGIALITLTGVGLNGFMDAIQTTRVALFIENIEQALENPRDTMDVEALNRVIDRAPSQSIDTSLMQARQAGVTVRRLSYNGASMGLSAFLTIVTGLLAILFGLRFFSRMNKLIDRVLASVAVPATSIFLALVAAAVVILSLQPTPLGRDVVISGPYMGLVGRLDTLWYAYQTLFADSLGTLNGFAESLKFATPLIFTGLAVAFGFQAGLFNIGAPGQMVLGAIFAMLVGVYLPGPRLIVLPLAVLASAVGGGIWGGIPGWLKARFGANEVINTILMNYIAASLLLFILSANPTFAAPALRIIYLLAAVAVLAILLSLIPAVRKQVAKSPRPIAAVLGVVILVAVIAVGLPRAGDAPVVFNLPFKVAGSEPKSHPLSEAARLKQIPALVGIDIETNPGTNIVPINVAAFLAPIVAIIALMVTPRMSRSFKRWRNRLGAAVVAGAVTYGVAALFGLTALEVPIPPTKLNTSFLLAIASAVIMYVLLWRTKWGYELRAVGVAPKAAEYGGANIARNIILTMVISGAFAGLTASHYVLGGALEDYALRQSLPTSDGFDGIAVALLGGNTPVGIVLSAFLFGVLKNGGSVLNITFTDLTRDVVNMILALVVLFIAAKGFLPARITNPVRRQAYLSEQEQNSSGESS